MKKRKNIKLRLIITLAIVCISVICLYTQITISSYLKCGFYPLEKAMKLAGYTPDDSKTSFSSCVSGKDIIITFDFENKICKKNLYSFEIQRDVKKFLGHYFVDKTLLNSVVGGEFYYVIAKMKYEEYFYSNHEWCNVSRLIAHAGGAVREQGV